MQFSSAEIKTRVKKSHEILDKTNRGILQYYAIHYSLEVDYSEIIVGQLD